MTTLKILIGEVINLNGKELTISERESVLGPKMKFVKSDRYICFHYDQEMEEITTTILPSTTIEPLIKSESYKEPITHCMEGDLVRLKSGSPDLRVTEVDQEDESKITIIYSDSRDDLHEVKLNKYCVVFM